MATNMEETVFRINDLVASAKAATSLTEALDHYYDAGKVALKLAEDAQVDYIRSSFRSRSYYLLDRAIKIKALIEKKGTNTSDPFDMSKIDQALEDEEPTDMKTLLLEPLNKRELPKDETLIVLRASKIYGQVFKPCGRGPDAKDLTQTAKFVDGTSFRLPNPFSEQFIGWMSPEEVFHESLPEDAIRTPSMTAEKPINLVQDAAHDCSLVAGLCALVGRTERGFPSLLDGVMYPYDKARDRPAFSKDGRYLFRFYFNGSYRLIEVDDRLPISGSERVLHVTDRNNPTLLWPALLEKAYLKLRAGGYDWNGSNSSADLWIITGWVPEIVILQDPYPIEEEVWRRIYQPFHNGDVLVTIGTPPMSRDLEKFHGLIGNHNYAVLDLKIKDGKPQLLIKNPWCDSPVLETLPEQLDEDVERAGTPINSGAMTTPGTFWISLSKAFRQFKAMYLNWNPVVFRSRKDLHFLWDLTKPQSRTLATSPQFAIKADQDTTVWFLLGRHLQDPVLEPDIMTECNQKSATIQETANEASAAPRSSLNGFTSMFLLDRNGVQSFLSGGYVANSPFVDGISTVLVQKLQKGKTYTLAVKGNKMPSIRQHFTLSTYSHAPVQLNLAHSKYAHSQTISSHWGSGMYDIPSTSGLLNPQFSITVPRPTAIAAFLDCEDDFVNINLKLCKRSGRILNPKILDILAESHSTEYELGGAWLETAGWEVGSKNSVLSYSLIVLNPDANYRGKFSLRIESNLPVKVDEIPPEYSWHLLRPGKAIFSGAATQMAAPILPCVEGDRMKVLVRFDSNFIPAKVAASDSTSNVSDQSILAQANAAGQSLIKITLQAGYGPESKIIASTSTPDEEFRPVSDDGLRLSELNVWKDMTQEWDLFLVVERFGGCTLPGSEERFIVDILTEHLGSVKIDSWRGWDD